MKSHFGVIKPLDLLQFQPEKTKKRPVAKLLEGLNQPELNPKIALFAKKNYNQKKPSKIHRNKTWNH